MATSPAGTAEIMGPMSRSQLRQERDCASEASRSNGGIETREGDFYAWCGDKLSPLRSGWGQLVPTSPCGIFSVPFSCSLRPRAANPPPPPSAVVSESVGKLSPLRSLRALLLNQPSRRDSLGDCPRP